MIGYFLKADREGLPKLDSVLNGKNGIVTLAKEGLKGKSFGSDLEMILIKIFVESDLLLEFNPEMLVGSHSKKEKATSIRVPITKAMLQLSREQLRALVVKLTCEALDLVSRKLAGRVDTNFIMLKAAFLDAVKLPDGFDWSAEPEPQRFWE